MEQQVAFIAGALQQMQTESINMKAEIKEFKLNLKLI
jgi:hypothetical protein